MSLLVLLLGVLAAGPASHGGRCLLVGDSIAVRLAPFEPQCTLVAKNGITSDEVVAMAPPDAGYTRVIASMGGNDWRTHAVLADNLVRLRLRYPQARFVWFAARRGRNIGVVDGFAAGHGDAVVHLADFPSRDNTHPDNLADVAARLP